MSERWRILEKKWRGIDHGKLMRLGSLRLSRMPTISINFFEIYKITKSDLLNYVTIVYLIN